MRTKTNLDLMIAAIIGVALGVIEAVVRSNTGLSSNLIPSIATLAGVSLGLTLLLSHLKAKADRMPFVPMFLANVIAVFIGQSIGLAILSFL